MLIIVFCKQFMLSYVAMVADLWEAEEPRSGLGGAGVPSLLNSNALRVTVTWEPPPPPAINRQTEVHGTFVNGQ